MDKGGELTYRMSKNLAISMTCASVALLVAVIFMIEGPPDSWDALTVIVFSVSGAFMAARVPHNAIGWILVCVGLLLSLGLFGLAYAEQGLPGATMAAFLASLLWVPAFIALTVLVPLLFPDGSLPSRRQRWVLWVTGLGAAMFVAGNMFTPTAIDIPDIENPFVISGADGLLVGIAAVGALLVGVCIVAAGAAAVTRFRRSRGDTRQQMKWFAVAVGILVATVVGMSIANESGHEQLVGAAFFVGALSVVVAIGVAILRYRLYEIDRLISRTVSYTLVIMLSAVVFFGVVTLLPSLLPAESDLAVAGSTLAVAALFNPLRRRVQAWVDRRFNRSRYDAQKVMDEFSGSLRDRVDPDEVVEGWVRAVSETMQPTTVAVWVREGS